MRPPSQRNIYTVTVPEATDDSTPSQDAHTLQPRRASRVQSALEVLLCSGFPTQLLIGGLLAALAQLPMVRALGLGLRPTAAEPLPFTFVVVVSLLDTVAIVVLACVFLMARGERPRDVILGRGPLWPEVTRGLAWVPGVFAVMIAVGGLLQVVAPWTRTVPTNPLQAMLTSPERVALFAGVVVIAGGLREEVQRAFVLHRFERDLGGAWVGLVIFSVAFGLGHITQGLDATIVTGVLGFLWGLIYLARRSAVAPAVSHAVFNLAEIALFQYASRHGLLPGA